jgi:hypothetical protein
LIINKALYSLFLSFMYYMTVRLFVIYGLMSEFTLLGESYQAVFAFYLTYFAFISVYYSDMVNSMSLVRYKTYTIAIFETTKRLMKDSLIFTTIYTIIILLILLLNLREIGIFYAIKFYILINICLLLLGLLLVALHLLFNSKIAFIGTVLYFLLMSLFVSVDGTANPYSPIYLYLAPVNSIVEFGILTGMILLYVSMILVFFHAVKKVRKLT